MQRKVFAISFCLAIVGIPGDGWSQATGDPITTSAPLAPWQIVLEDVVQIPDSQGSAPRLEHLVWNETTALAYVIDQRGTIYSFDPDAASPVAQIFLDLAAAVGDLETGNESGVRSMAFHPDFDAPGEPGYRKMYVTLSRSPGSVAVGGPVVFDSPGSTNHWTVLSEWTLDLAGNVDLASYRELMRIEQPFGNHNSGHLGFDPTVGPGSVDYGLLYLSVGDGGSGGGPFDLSLDIDLDPAPYPHGKILRIDPIASGGAPYAVPPGNPFFAVANRLPEIWAYGMRNPHKFHFDPLTGRLFVADIGQGVVEEISVVRKGSNLGWNAREGAFEYLSGSTVGPLPLDHATDDFSYPVAQYDHVGNGIFGSAAIVGGPIYRGSALPELDGSMFFADFSSNPGPIFAVHVSALIERSDFSGIGNLAGGRLAPFEEVLIRDLGADKTFRQFLRDANGLPSLSRTDLRFGVGSGGDIYFLNKHDGMVRRVADVLGHPGPPAMQVPGLSPLGVLAVMSVLSIVAVRMTSRPASGRSR